MTGRRKKTTDKGTRPHPETIDPGRPPVHGRADKCARVAVNAAAVEGPRPRPRVRVVVWGPAGFFFCASGSTVAAPHVVAPRRVRVLLSATYCSTCSSLRAFVPGVFLSFFFFSPGFGVRDLWISASRSHRTLRPGGVGESEHFFD